ncbi:PhzF family phenazine biosynthesis protein [Vibrio sp. JC009]|uniref:PhzF family phenazine biosynthesis protein n=1 Tax=Vibrio sp. JC009 TaxID=2912314 RepID=UPI0023B04BA3|nr:PhzF family phenazine biosynthesis protein [Vibrio sp. JC009]WED22796.1 PhzF family phenazine biosynthesis protein [Vibrio sp. JC009]
MEVSVELVSAFTSNGSGGNPAGVVFRADHLSYEQKLLIAQMVGYSETAFVSSSDTADFHVSFFTVAGEVDFCGHATLATFSMMYQKDILSPGKYTQETKAGVLAVDIQPDGKVMMQQKLPQWSDKYSPGDIASLIGIDSEVLEGVSLPIQVVSTGLADLIIPVPAGCLDKLRPNHDAITKFCREHNLVGIHAFELCDSESSYTASCRNFAPLFGIEEESATGSSSGALACYLSRYHNVQSEYLFEQGRAMNCRSEIFACVEVIDSEVRTINVGGVAQLIGSKELVISQDEQ